MSDCRKYFYNTPCSLDTIRHVGLIWITMLHLHNDIKQISYEKEFRLQNSNIDFEKRLILNIYFLNKVLKFRTFIASHFIFFIIRISAIKICY